MLTCDDKERVRDDLRTVGIAVAVALLAGQAPRVAASDNYNGLSQITKATAPHELKKAFQPDAPRVAGRVIEKQTGLERGPCGMPVIAADASVDPRIIIPIPDDARQNAKIRIAEPAPCGATLSNADRK